jgi:RNA polymerase sigma-70 factor, ECF subfamily
MSKTSAMSGSEELQQLLMQMSGKDEVAFDRLHARTKRKLFSVVLPIVGRRHLAEEVIQDAYVRIWQNAALYRPSLGAPMNWMITIARNLAIDFVRRPAREIYFEDQVYCNFPSDMPTALEAIEIAEEQAVASSTALRALQVLDPARRQLIIAAYIRGESRKQLSEHHRVPVNTIKTWIRRALLETRANFQAQAELRIHEEHPDRNRIPLDKN